ncbi:hypothetical protein KUTeg_011582 [Tegillarca granosa]|uniref:Uncharacterized protein n=1 Tax=Tegillarca granosa TaxID=220873 RepID=A0ABQ9F1H4_TEGGR|nr:hypothetical protein KUTeg_011582 [Tegillarca granosa]
MFKSFVELNWNVFFSELCKLMGLKSENAQNAAKKCTDNHKTWSLLQIAYEGTLQELMIPYVRECLTSNSELSPKGFLSFALTEAKDPNYLYMATMTLPYLQSIINMRIGLRLGNSLAINAAKTIFAPLFHSRNHARYQEIEMSEAVQRLMVPKELIPFYDETESVCLTGDKMSEVVNKEVQSWMPRGVPTGNDWIRVTRNWETLKNLTKKAKEFTCTTAKKSGARKISLQEQIFAWRTLLRRKEYLLNPCDGNKKHISLSSEELDIELLDFNTLAERRRQSYFNRKYGDAQPDETLTRFYNKKRNERIVIC